ncbi:MAG TPA: hypothetical protein VIK93_12340 [Limnochordales bacterium]
MDVKGAVNHAEARGKTDAALGFNQPLDDHELAAVAGGIGAGHISGNTGSSFQCGLCHQRFPTFDELEEHQRLFHSISSAGGLFA